ncbi:MAG: AI-2E family transporter [Propionibacteriaceae bacterium]|jgi:predicted PurR-regulated permease PerM|nr:AI-2E family transporter [Propionibacteriaceae bacterium]
MDKVEPGPASAVEPAEDPVEDAVAAGEAITQPTLEVMAAPTQAPVAPPLRVSADLRRPFVWGFIATVGGLVAISLGGALASLSTVLIWIGVALFVALALDPIVHWLESHKISRGLSIVIVFVGFALVLGGLLAWIIPAAVTQISQFAAAVPGYITNLQQSDWFISLVNATGQSNLAQTVLDQARSWLSDPANLLKIGGGALAVGTGVINGISGTLIVIVLTLYFLAALRSIKDAAVRVAPAYARPQLREFVDGITEAVGGYVSGMGILAICNAIMSFILLSILGQPFAALLAVLALAVTMIPMIGSVTFWIIASVVTLFTSWWAALIFAVVYFVYMQVEAYVMTPRVMNKAVDIPGSLVLIGALVGGTLLGLLGALVAVPVTASLLMIVQKVFLPKQDAKTVAVL